MNCQRTITENGFSGTKAKWKCGKPATDKQDDGLPLCKSHFNKWLKKNPNSKQNKETKLK